MNRSYMKTADKDQWVVNFFREYENGESLPINVLITVEQDGTAIMVNLSSLRATEDELEELLSHEQIQSCIGRGVTRTEMNIAMPLQNGAL